MLHERRSKVNMEKQDTIEQAYNYLKNELGKNIQWKRTAHVAKDQGWDAKFQLNNKVIYVEAKNEVRPNNIDQLVYLKEKLGELIVAVNYITPNAKHLLKERGINYVDRKGNIWFKYGKVHIYIEGIPNQPPTEDRKNRAFTRAGIQVVFQILLHTNLINATYRELAVKCNVALGTIPKVIGGLKEEGFLIKADKNVWLLTDYEELLKRWQQEYVRKLKPTLFMCKYKATDKEFGKNWKQLKLKGYATWGGEPAGDFYTKYLKPEIFTLYTNQTQQALMRAYRWVPDEDGNIVVYNTFWNYPDDKRYYVPPLLAYADLMGTGDGRCVETANMIYEQLLQKP